MKEKNEHIFEDKLKGVFNNAQKNPSSELWDKIEAELDKAEKDKWGFYKIAAGILLLLSIGLTAGWYITTQNLREKIASFEKRNDNSLNKKSILLITKSNTNITRVDSSSNKKKFDKKNNFTYLTNTTNNKINKNKIVTSPSSPKESELIDNNKYFSLPPLYSKELNLSYLSLSNQTIPYLAATNEVAYYDKKDEKKRSDQTARFYIGGSTGPSVLSLRLKTDNQLIAGENYHKYGKSNFGSVSNIQVETNNALSYNIGVKTGLQFSKHWIIETGINYSYNVTDIQTNGLWEDNLFQLLYPSIYTSPEDIITIRLKKLPSLPPINTGTPMPDYTSLYKNSESINLNTQQVVVLRNSYQFISIPIKVGYKVNSNRWNYCTSIGVSSDFLISAHSSPIRSRSSIVTSDNTINLYNRFSMSGLVSVSANYEIKKNLFFSIEPSYKISISPFTKNNALFTSKPAVFSLGMGFSYLF